MLILHQMVTLTFLIYILRLAHAERQIGNYKTLEHFDLDQSGGLTTVNAIINIPKFPFPIENLRDWKITNSSINHNRIRPIFLQNLEKLEIFDSEINPRSITFSDKLQTLIVHRCKFTNGNISDLMKTATQLYKLEIGGLGEFDIASVPADSIKYFIIDNNITIISSSRGQPVLFKNLEGFQLKKSQLDPNSIAFGNKLNYIVANSATFVNGTIYDFVNNATSLSELVFESNSYFDLANLRRLEKFTRLYFSGNCTVSSSDGGKGGILFPNLDVFSIVDSQIDPNSIKFSPTLRYFGFYTSTVINGFISDLMKSATNLKEIYLSTRDFKELDLSLLPISIQDMTLIGTWTLMSSRGHDSKIKFHNLSSIMLYGCQLNPHSFEFSNELGMLKVLNSTLINGTINDLLRTAKNLTLFQTANGGNIHIAALPAKTLETMVMNGNIKNALVWNGDEKIIFPNLLKFSFMDGEFNPNSIVFTEKLNDLTIMKTNLINGTVHDVLKMTTNLTILMLDDATMNDTDISTLPSANTLSELTLHSDRIHCTAQVTFPQLNSLTLCGADQLDMEKSFCDFSRTFPSLSFFSTGESKLQPSPKFILQLLEKPNMGLEFLVDMNPDRKSVEFENLINLLLLHGIADQMPHNYFSNPSDFPDDRFQHIRLWWTLDNDNYKMVVRANTFFFEELMKNSTPSLTLGQNEWIISMFLILPTLLGIISRQ